jgi:hypothetical protein
VHVDRRDDPPRPEKVRLPVPPYTCILSFSADLEQTRTAYPFRSDLAMHTVVDADVCKCTYTLRWIYPQTVARRSPVARHAVCMCIACGMLPLCLHRHLTLRLAPVFECTGAASTTAPAQAQTSYTTQRCELRVLVVRCMTCHLIFVSLPLLCAWQKQRGSACLLTPNMLQCPYKNLPTCAAGQYPITGTTPMVCGVEGERHTK